MSHPSECAKGVSKQLNYILPFSTTIVTIPHCCTWLPRMFLLCHSPFLTYTTTQKKTTLKIVSKKNYAATINGRFSILMNSSPFRRKPIISLKIERNKKFSTVFPSLSMCSHHSVRIHFLRREKILVF